MRERFAHVPNPTLSLREVVRALIRPSSLEQAERNLRAMVGRDVVLFASGRGALSAALVAVGAEEVRVPAYTCVAVPNAVLSAGGRVIWRDVTATGVADAEPGGGEVVLVQDTFGIPAPIPEGRVVRDCCHRADLVMERGPRVSVASFEQSKWLCAGEGGAAVTDDDEIADALRAIRSGKAPPSYRVAHGFFTLLTVLLGRMMWRGSSPRARRVLTLVLEALDFERMSGQSTQELEGEGIAERLAGAPNGTVAAMVVSQALQCAEISKHRRGVVREYDRAAGIARRAEPLCRYPMTIDDPLVLEEAMRVAGWILNGRWFDAPIHPAQSDPGAFDYVRGSAPRAEGLSRSVVNLPTHPLVSPLDARTLITIALEAGARPL